VRVESFVKPIALFLAVALGFGMSIGCRRPAARATPTTDCTPVYDAGLVAKQIQENDDPQFFAAFQEPPLYAMPACIDEAYSLTWIPSFHAPVLVQVWRSGNRYFMVGKSLDSKGWSKPGNIKETNARALTPFEWRDWTDALNRASYWSMTSTANELSPNDGAVWLIDGLRAKEYHWVRRRVPDEQFGELAKHLIRLSGLETAHALYLP